VPIRNWPRDERPREKLITHGAASLSDSELLAILLRTGRPGISAVAMGRDLLNEFGSISGVLCAKLEQFDAIKGFGTAKFAQLQVVLEVSKRTLAETLRIGTKLSSSVAMRDFLRLELGQKSYEVFFVLFLDSQNRLIEARELFRGTLGRSSVYPREVVKAALAANAASVVFAHNHPGGVASPTEADKTLTKVLTNALDLIDVRILDHLIIAAGEVYSFAEHDQISGSGV
jgi:DNA repair protein RadC